MQQLILYVDAAGNYEALSASFSFPHLQQGDTLTPSQTPKFNTETPQGASPLVYTLESVGSSTVSALISAQTGTGTGTSWVATCTCTTVSGNTVTGLIWVKLEGPGYLPVNDPGSFSAGGVNKTFGGTIVSANGLIQDVTYVQADTIAPIANSSSYPATPFADQIVVKQFDNNGVQNWNGSTWVDTTFRYFNVQSFWQSGDADWGPAIQRATDAAVAASVNGSYPFYGFGVVVFPAQAGGYPISQTIVVKQGGSSNAAPHATCNIIWECDHFGSQILWNGGSNASVIETYSCAYSQFKDVVIVIPPGTVNVVAWDCRTVYDVTNGLLRFENCVVNAEGSASNCIGWRLGMDAGGGGDFGLCWFERCIFEGTSALVGHIGWQFTGQNNCPVFLDNCGSSWTGICVLNGPINDNLSATINSSATSLPLFYSANLPPSGYVQVDGEIIQYTTNSGNSLGGLTRGALGSLAASHSVNAIVSQYLTLPASPLYLSSALTSSSTTVSLYLSAALPSQGYVQIDSEVIGYTTNTTASGTLSGLTRGALGTTATAHNAGEQVFQYGQSLSASITSSSGSLSLYSSANLPTAGYVQIDSEIIEYTSNNGNTLGSLTRGALGTTAASHSAVAPVFPYTAATSTVSSLIQPVWGIVLGGDNINIQGGGYSGSRVWFEFIDGTTMSISNVRCEGNNTPNQFLKLGHYYGANKAAMVVTVDNALNSLFTAPANNLGNIYYGLNANLTIRGWNVNDTEGSFQYGPSTPLIYVYNNGVLGNAVTTPIHISDSSLAATMDFVGRAGVDAVPIKLDNVTLCSGALAVVQTQIPHAGHLELPTVILTDAATINIDLSLSDRFLLPMASPGYTRTITVSNPTYRASWQLWLQQPSAGGQNIATWFSNITQVGTAGGSFSPSLTTGTGSAVDKIAFDLNFAVGGSSAAWLAKLN